MLNTIAKETLWNECMLKNVELCHLTGHSAASADAGTECHLANMESMAEEVKKCLQQWSFGG